MKKIILSILTTFCITTIHAQVGEYRNVFSIGVGGGYALNTIGFTPKVLQKAHGGYHFGLTGRYTCEKYFSMLCAVQLEANISQLGWQEDIKTMAGNPVINTETGIAEQYKRNQTYLQIPIFAHLSWGKERKGVNGFVNIGPQIGFSIGEQTNKNYETPNTNDANGEGRSNAIIAQENMPIENKFDYGIVAGAGIEVHINHVGRFDLEGRYYYGLGNIYGDSKRDYFGTSNHSTIFIKLSYLRDL